MSPLPSLNIPHERVQVRIVPFATRQGAKVLSPVSGFRWFREVEHQERTTVRLAHLEKEWTRWFLLTTFQGRQALRTASSF